MQHLKKVFEILKSQQLFLRKTKCMFAQQQVAYLGYRISEQGVKADLEKVEAMINWPKTMTITALRGFLGLIGYYHWFVSVM